MALWKDNRSSDYRTNKAQVQQRECRKAKMHMTKMGPDADRDRDAAWVAERLRELGWAFDNIIVNDDLPHHSMNRVHVIDFRPKSLGKKSMPYVLEIWSDGTDTGGTTKVQCFHAPDGGPVTLVPARKLLSEELLARIRECTYGWGVAMKVNGLDDLIKRVSLFGQSLHTQHHR